MRDIFTPPARASIIRFAIQEDKENWLKDLIFSVRVFKAPAMLKESARRSGNRGCIGFK